jgi:hypothetical protein
MSPYEQFKVQNLQAKEHTGGVAITGMVTGVAGVIIGGTAWLFSGLFTNAKAKEAKEAAYAAEKLANAQIGATQRQLDQLTNLFAAERSERIEGDRTLSISINDSVSGQQSGQLSASQVATNEATAQIVAGVMTGKYTESPQKVELYSPASPFQCGCGCNG